MAINTQNKRRSTIYILPVPNGSIDVRDRRQVAYIYSGFPEVIPGLGGLYNVPAEDRVYVVPKDKERIYNVPAEDRVYEVPQ